MAPNQRATPVIIRARPIEVSRAARLMGWLAIPWALVVLIGGQAVLDRLGLYPEPLVLRLTLVFVAFTPGALAVASPWLGRLPTMGWLLASPQPEARLDFDGFTLILPNREPVRFSWSEITAMQPANDFGRSAHLLGADGAVLTTIPNALAYPRGWSWVRSLAQDVVAARPDRYVLTGTNVAGVADRFALRDADSPIPDIDPVRRQALALSVMFALLAGFGIVVAVIWFGIGAAE